jgi:hypothetical protein
MPSTVAEKSATRDRWIAVYIGALSVVLAICALGGDNAAKEASSKNIEAANIWAWYQAKNMRRDAIRLQISELELLIATQPDLSPQARNLITDRIAAYRSQEALLTSEPDKGEGLEQLFVRGKALEAERDLARKQDPFFDHGQALLQIAIVLASVAIVSGGRLALTMSGLLGIGGTALTANGFALGAPGAVQWGQELLQTYLAALGWT